MNESFISFLTSLCSSITPAITVSTNLICVVGGGVTSTRIITTSGNELERRARSEASEATSTTRSDACRPAFQGCMGAGRDNIASSPPWQWAADTRASVKDCPGAALEQGTVPPYSELLSLIDMMFNFDCMFAVEPINTHLLAMENCYPHHRSYGKYLVLSEGLHCSQTVLESVLVDYRHPLFSICVSFT